MRILSTLIALALSTAYAGAANAETPAETAPVIRSLETLDRPATLIRVQDVNHPPVCTDWTIRLNAPSYATASSSVSFQHRCSDPDGDPITIINPSNPYTFVMNPGVNVLTIPFTASDGRGGTASAVLTIYR
jgi:hypothetical protein